MGRLLLIASSGGHIYEMFCLREFWQDKDRFWVSFATGRRPLSAARRAGGLLGGAPDRP